MVSASVLEISNVNTPTEIAEDAGSFDITFDLTYTGTVDDKAVTFADSTVTIGSISISDTTIDPNETKTLTGTVTFPTGNAGETLGGIINATSGTTVETANFSVPIIPSEEPSFCSDGAINTDDLDLEIDIKNLGEGEEDDEWLPLDKIEVDVELQNDKDLDGEGDLNNVVFELGSVSYTHLTLPTN